MTSFKFGLLVIEDAPTGEEPFQLGQDAWTFERPFDALFDAKDIEHRRSWVGFVEWSRMTGAARLVSLRYPSERLNVIDHENQAIQQRLEQIRLALLLTGPNGLVSGETWVFDGQAANGEWDGPLSGIQTSARHSRIVRPLYTTLPAFADLRPWPRETGWLERWKGMLEKLSVASRGGYPPLLFFALIAFDRAFEPYAIEFKVPDCVRSAEAVLGLPRNGGGRREFARRVFALLPELEQDQYLGGAAIGDRLMQLYDHRADCVHGKIPFAKLKDLGADGEDEAAKFDYLAEYIARGVLNRALEHPRMREVLADRAVLESAWATGSFP